MESTSRLHSQIAAAAEVSEQAAQIAAYLLDLSRAGRTLDYAATMLRKERGEVRDIARDWGIEFVDYKSSTPLLLKWTKPRRGEWALEHEGETVARVTTACDKHGVRYYSASWQRHDASIRETGSSAEIAARRLSKVVDRRSISLFGVDDIVIKFPLPHNLQTVLAPTFAANVAKLQCAIHG